MIMKKTEYRYEIILYWSEEDNAYIAEVSELPGSAADGASCSEAIRMPKWSLMSG